MLEDAAYRRLLDAYFCNHRLPSDLPRLQRIARAITLEEKAAVDFVVKRFFRVDGERLVNNRAEREIEARDAFFAEQGRKAKLGGRPPKQPGGNPGDIPGDKPGETRGVSHSDSDSDSELRAEERNRALCAKKPHAFIPPTVERVRSYCAERRNTIDPQHFVDSNEAKGWLIGKNRTPAKDWKAMIRTWERNEDGAAAPIHGGNGEDHQGGQAAPLPPAVLDALREVEPDAKRSWVASVLASAIARGHDVRESLDREKVGAAVIDRVVESLREGGSPS
jgi:hypothetical protein